MGIWKDSSATDVAEHIQLSCCLELIKESGSSPVLGTEWDHMTQFFLLTLHY
jgi:hypothetical protein